MTNEEVPNFSSIKLGAAQDLGKKSLCVRKNY